MSSIWHGGFFQGRGRGSSSVGFWIRQIFSPESGLPFCSGCVFCGVGEKKSQTQLYFVLHICMIHISAYHVCMIHISVYHVCKNKSQIQLLTPFFLCKVQDPQGTLIFPRQSQCQGRNKVARHHLTLYAPRIFCFHVVFISSIHFQAL